MGKGIVSSALKVGNSIGFAAPRNVVFTDWRIAFTYLGFLAMTSAAPPPAAAEGQRCSAVQHQLDRVQATAAARDSPRKNRWVKYDA